MQSTTNKTTNLETLMSELDNEFSVATLIETWYENTNDYYNVPHYKICNLNCEYGRGVSMLRSDVNYELIPSFTQSTRDFEVLSILSNKSYFYGILATSG